MKILIISLAGIGDSLIATPLIKELRKNFPKAKIDVLVMWEQAKKLLETNPYLDRIYQFSMTEKGHVKSILFCLGLRGKKYDISINTHPQSKIQYRVVSWLIGAKERLSHEYDNKSFFDRILINKNLKQNYNISSIDNNINLLKLINIKQKLEKHDYEVFLTENDKKKAGEFFKKIKTGRKIIGFHVGSGRTKNLKLKRWALKNYILLIKKILNDKEIKILLFGGEDELEENIKILNEVNDKRIILVKTDNIRETAAIIKFCKIFISVDGLLMHIASAMKVPKQIVIAGPTYDKSVEPKRKPVVIKSDIKCRPCYRYNGKGIECKHKEFRKCLKDITPEKVYGVVKKLIK